MVLPLCVWLEAIETAKGSDSQRSLSRANRVEEGKESTKAAQLIVETPCGRPCEGCSSVKGARWVNNPREE